MQIFERITANTGLPITDHAFDRILAALEASSDPWEVVDLADQPFNLTVETVKQLAEEGYVSAEGGQVYLTEAGQELLRKRRVTASRSFRCPSCEGSGVHLSDFTEAFETFRELGANRPEPVDEYDQGTLSVVSAMRRAVTMLQRGDVTGKRIAILGDDDLMTLALGLISDPEEIVTFEIDERYVDYIQEHSRRLRIPARVVSFDLRQTLPEDLYGGFDTFLTDPPENMDGLLLFLERGFGLLRPADGSAGYFGMTLTESSLQKWHQLQKWLLNEHHVVMTDLFYENADYDNWAFLLDSIRSDFEPYTHFPRINWYRSSLFRVETLPEFVPRNDPFKGDEIYSDAERLVYTKELEQKRLNPERR